MQRIVILATASGSGKTTLGRRLAEALDVPFVELDAIHHQAGWRELSADELRQEVEPIAGTDAWVIDGAYRGKLGDLVLERADTIVWIDLPRRVWLPRLVRRTLRRILLREELWNGNRESLRTALAGRSSLLAFTLRNEPRRRQRYPRELARFRVARLRSQRQVDAFLRSARRRHATSAGQGAPATASASGYSPSARTADTVSTAAAQTRFSAPARASVLPTPSESEIGPTST
jgi:adenylate kinase family enzyme